MNIAFLSILGLCFELCSCFTDKTKMIVDVIKSYDKPTAVLVNVCWKLREKTNFMAQIMKTDKATVLFITDQIEILKFEPKDTLIVTDLNCPSSGSFLQEAEKNHGFSKSYRWLMVTKPGNNIGNVPADLSYLNILVDSEVVVAEKVNDAFKLNLIYRIDATSEFRTENFGLWRAAEGLKISEEITKTSMVIRRRDLNGKSIAASYVISDNSSRTKMNDLTTTKVDNVAKATHHNILPLYYFMNATNKYLFTNIWGFYANNTWNGMFGDVIQGEAELCGAISFISLGRVNLVQYITQPIPILPKFIFRDPPLSFQNNLFLLPFRGAVWMCIGGLVLILIMIIYFNAKWESFKDESIMNNANRLKPNVSDIGIFVVSAITQQGSTNELKGSLGRVVTFLMFLIFLFLYTSYSANIVALLQSSSNQIRTLTDLLNSRLELGVEDVTYNRHYFPAATDPVRKAIYETKVAKVGYKPNFMSIEEGVRRLQNKDSPFAFHVNLGTAYKIVEELFHEHEKCGLHEILYYANNIPWVCSKKATPYREIYKVGLARTFEHGLADRVNRIFFIRKPYCTTRGGSFASVNMVDFHPVLLWMLYGMSLSVSLLVVEILLYRTQRRREEE